MHCCARLGVVLAFLLAAPDHGLPPAELAAQAKLATSQVAAAERALLNRQPGKARVALERAEAPLRSMYAGVMGGELVQRLQEAETRLRRQQRLAPAQAELAVDVERYARVLDPSVLERVQRAERELRRGHRDEAARYLRLAREQMSADLGLQSIERAWALVMAAQLALQRGDSPLAQRLLESAPALLAEVSLRAPLIPIAEQLHQAALAANAGDHDEAELTLEEAAEQLREVEANSEDRIARELRPLLAEVEDVLSKSEGREEVRPAELRALAERANALERAQAR